MGRERMSSVDTAWLRMDSPQNLMMIVGFQVFEQPVAYDDLRQLFERRLLKFNRFKQRVDSDTSGSWWIDDRKFDLARHFVRETLPAGAGQIELQALVARLASEPLDPQRPLWQFHLLENYQGKTALVTRVHHCIGDGIALVAVMLSLTDSAGGVASADTSASAGTAATAAATEDSPTFTERDGELESNPWRPYVKPLEKGTISAIHATGSVWSKSLEILANPDKLVDYAQIGSQVLRDALQIALMPNDSATCLKGTPGTTKAVAWNDPLPLDEVKAVCRALGASVNDVLLSCVAGAIRTYLLGRGEVANDCEVRAMVPVNLRPLNQALELGNRFGLVPLCLPVGIANPIARVREVRRRMDDLKGGYQALLAFGVLGLVGLAPKPVQTFVLEMLASKATAVMTNVPGPQQPIYMAGSMVSRIMVWVPQSGNVGVGVSILSYNGGVQFGLMTDTNLCPDPQRIIDGFAPEFEKLVLMLSLLPAEMFMDSSLDAAAFEQALFGVAEHA
jgi:diacylglycerol O-acyltransferase / wax synthase